jgi:hypothetical protein
VGNAVNILGFKEKIKYGYDFHCITETVVDSAEGE